MFLGDMKSNYENYQSVRMDGIVGNMKSDSFFLMDSYVFNPVGQFHVMKLSKLLVKAGVRFRQKVRSSRCWFLLQVYLHDEFCGRSILTPLPGSPSLTFTPP